MSDESDDICCPPCQTSDSEKTPIPSSHAPNPTRKYRTTSEKVSASSASRESKTESKPKKKAVSKPSVRGNKPKRQPPKRVQPPVRRKRVGKGLHFEDDLSPVQETTCLQDNVQSSSDDDGLGKRILRSRKKTKQKETGSDKNEKRAVQVGKTGGPSNQQDCSHDQLQVLPASGSISFAVTTEVPIGFTATHQLIDELFGEEPVHQESSNPEANACTSSLKTTTKDESGDNCAVSASSIASDVEDCEGALSASAQLTTKSKDHGSSAYSNSDKEYTENTMHCQKETGSKDAEELDLDAELFGF